MYFKSFREEEPIKETKTEEKKNEKVYNSRFKFVLTANNNIVCERYFSINRYYYSSSSTREFLSTMRGIVDLIKNDLTAKSRVYSWYTEDKRPLKLTGFLPEGKGYGDNYTTVVDHESGEEMVRVMTVEKTEDGLPYFHYQLKPKKGSIAENRNNITSINVEEAYQKYHIYDNAEDTKSQYEDDDAPFDFVFSFQMATSSSIKDDGTTIYSDFTNIYEQTFDGKLYPRFIRNSVDLTNSTYERSGKNYQMMLDREIKKGRKDLVFEIIRRICEVTSTPNGETYCSRKIPMETNLDSLVNEDR